MAPRKNDEVTRLVKKIQNEVRTSRGQTLPLDAQLRADLARYQARSAIRKYSGSNWVQMTSPLRNNPAVGLYIQPDAQRFLEITNAGVPHLMDFAAAVQRHGESSLRRWSSQAVQHPPVRHVRIGEDVLSAFRSFQAKPPVEAAPPRRADASKPSTGARDAKRTRAKSKSKSQRTPKKRGGPQS